MLTVEKTVLIEGRGILAMPLISDYNGPMSFPAILRTPGGEESSIQVRLDIPRINPPRTPFPLACVLEGTRKECVPIGSEIWFLNEDSA